METFSLNTEVLPPDPTCPANDNPPQEPDSHTESIEEQVNKGLFLYEADEFINIRVLFDNSRMTSQFSRGKHKLAKFIAGIDKDPEIKAIYVQLQVLNPASLTNIPPGKGVKRQHVSRYRWFVVDIDTQRPNKGKTNATNEEKEHSLLVTRAVSLHLQNLAWPEPVLCDSGNGWHLVWKIDLDNSHENYQMLRSCLLALAARFNNEHAEIDYSLAEPEQIIKLWGTMVRKRENSPLRPWRRSSVVTMPDCMEVVSMERLQQLATQAPAKSPSSVTKRRQSPELDADFDPEDFFEWCQENLPKEYQGFFARDADADHDDADGHHYVMDGCFWAERKHSGDRKKTEFILGKTFGVKCFSDDCDGVRIGDILRKVTKLAGKPYPGQIWKQDESIFDNVDFIDEVDVLAEEASDTESVEKEQPEEDSVLASACVEDKQDSGNTTESQPGSDPLAFPEEAMCGKLGEMAAAMKMPLGLAYPALIGAYSVLPEMDEMAGTRINGYVILLAPPGGGKNVAIKRAMQMTNLPKELFRKAAPVSDRGLMSLIGHRKEKKRGGVEQTIRGPRKLLLVTNEAANVLKKANIKNSSLGSTLCELWDENQYTAADRHGEQPCDCRLSWLGGLPIRRDHPEEFGEYFGRETGRGLVSRTILGFSDAKFNYKRWTPPSRWSKDEQGDFDEMAFLNPGQVEICCEAEQMLDAWKANDEEEEGRFKYNATKVALLAASANGDKEVGIECMKAAIEFAEWQGRLREVFTIGVAAEFSLEAQFAEALIGALKQKGGDKKFIAWRRLAHDRKWVERFGPRVVNTTVENLIKSGTIEPFQKVVEGDDGKQRVETNSNKVKLRTWKE